MPFLCIVAPFLRVLSPVKSEPPRAVAPLITVAVAPWFFLVALFGPSRGDAEAPVSAQQTVSCSVATSCCGCSSTPTVVLFFRGRAYRYIEWKPS